MRHIGQSKACKAFYGERFEIMKKKQCSKRKSNYYQNISEEKRKNTLERQKVRLAKNPERKEKKKHYYRNGRKEFRWRKKKGEKFV